MGAKGSLGNAGLGRVGAWTGVLDFNLWECRESLQMTPVTRRGYDEMGVL